MGFDEVTAPWRSTRWLMRPFAASYVCPDRAGFAGLKGVPTVATLAIYRSTLLGLRSVRLGSDGVDFPPARPSSVPLQKESTHGALS